MNEQERVFPTNLFMLRIWREPLGAGKEEWRGKVQHVLTGEVRYFRGWDMLACQLLSMLENTGPRPQDDPR